MRYPRPMGEYISIQNKARVSHTRCASSIVRKRTISGQPYYFHSLVQRAALVVSLLISNAILPLVPSDQSGVPTLVNGDMPGRTTEEREREREPIADSYMQRGVVLYTTVKYVSLYFVEKSALVARRDRILKATEIRKLIICTPDWLDGSLTITENVLPSIHDEYLWVRIKVGMWD